MEIGAPCAETYLEPKQKEQSHFMFINQSPKYNKHCPGINQIGLGTPWANTYLKPQQKESFSVIYIKQSLKFHQNNSRDSPHCYCCLSGHLIFITPTKETIFYNVKNNCQQSTKYCRGNNPMGIGAPWTNTFI